MVHSGKLESESGEPLTLKCLTPGAKVLWNYRGTPYGVEIISVASRFPTFYRWSLFQACKMLSNIPILYIYYPEEKPGKSAHKQPKKVYPEDSDDSEEDVISKQPLPCHKGKEKVNNAKS